MKLLAFVLCFVTLSFSQLSYFNEGQSGGFISAGGAFSDGVSGFILSGGAVPSGRVVLEAAYMHASLDNTDITTNGFGVGGSLAALKQNDAMPITLPLSLHFQYESISSATLTEYGADISGKTFIFGVGLERNIETVSVFFIPKVVFSYYTTTVTTSAPGYGSDNTDDDGQMIDLGLGLSFKISPTANFIIEPGVTLGLNDQDPVFNIAGVLSFGQ